MKTKTIALIGLIALILSVGFLSMGVHTALAEEPIDSSAVVETIENEDITDAWEEFKAWWNEWGGTIIAFLTSGTFGTLVIAVVRGLIVKFISANKTANLTEKDKIDIAVKVVDSIVGKELNINPNDALNGEVRAELEDLEDGILKLAELIKKQYDATGIMAQGISRSKLLTEDESAELSALAASLKNEPFGKHRTIAKVEIQKKEEKKNDLALME